MTDVPEIVLKIFTKFGAAHLQAAQVAASLPDLKKLVDANAVVAEHLDALNHCDWNRVVAPNTPRTRRSIYLAGGG